MLLLLHFGIQRALKIGGDAAEFSHGLAEGAGNTCQALGPQHHEGHKKDNQKFRTADTEHIFLCFLVLCVRDAEMLKRKIT